MDKKILDKKYISCIKLEVDLNELNSTNKITILLLNNLSCILRLH